MKPTREQAKEAVRTLIAYIGDNPERQGLLDTPERVVSAWEKDWGVGYNPEHLQQQEASIHKGTFEDGAEKYDQMILVRRIHFVSHCEHHLAIFAGTADVAYIPNEKGCIIGLSKIARAVEMFSRRLQVQERLTTQIADYINENLKPLGVGVVVRATHLCMSSRGVRQPEAETVTSALRGEMLDSPEVRGEFLHLVGLK